jgi:hypothetical protein
MDKEIVLKCIPLRFYTQNDEDICFEWIKKIKCIKKYVGVGRELHLYISSNNISNDNLLDLMGLFDRYKFDSSQLKIFMNDKNKDWFD